METLEKSGFSIIRDFISQEEEIHLLEYLYNAPRKNTKSRNNIQRFGSSLPYKSNMISNEIPKHFNFLLDRIMDNNILDVITVNQYLKGQFISPHIDSKTSGSVITILSLLSDVNMIFTLNKQKESVEFPARSLVQLKNDIRNIWQHSIEPVKSTRYSIVFRCSTT